jgi:Lipase
LTGCEDDPLSENICSHIRAWEFFQASITEPTSFPAIKCASYDDFMTQNNGGKCDQNDINYMGFGAYEK